MDRLIIERQDKLGLEVRALLGLPYAQKIAEAFNPYQTNARTLIGRKNKLLRRLVVRTCARHLTVIDHIRDSGITQVLGLGEAFLPNGLLLTKEPSFRYVETDCHKAIFKKQEVIEAMGCGGRENLAMVEVSMLEERRLLWVAGVFLRKEPVIINAQDVVAHLDMSQRHRLGSNIRKVLEIHGGSAIITGVISRERYRCMSDTQLERVIRCLDATHGDRGKQVFSQAFEGDGHVAELFGNEGLTAEPIDHTRCFSRLLRSSEYDLPDEDVQKILSGMKSYVLRLQK